MIIGVFDNKLCLFDFVYRAKSSTILNQLSQSLQAEFIKEEHPLHLEIKHQVQSYFDKKRKTFDIPLVLVGTSFQQQVWNELLKIPYGETTTYKKQAEKMGNPLLIRAVASANGNNKIAIIIPCHRVIGSNGSLIGYAGGLQAKRKLLHLENENSNNKQWELF